MRKEVSEEENIKERRSLVGRICTKRNISRDVIQATMKKIWRLHKAASFKEAGRNLFIITFFNSARKTKSDGEQAMVVRQ